MARRRTGALQAAGDVWRQQQQLAALAGALRQLPRGDALPVVVLQGLQRALECVEHTLQGPPSCGDAGSGGVDVLGGGGSQLISSGDCGGCGAAAAAGEKLGAAVAAEAAAAAEGRSEAEVRGTAVAAAQGRGVSCGESEAAAQVVRILRDLLASCASGRGGDGSGSEWCVSSYTESLLHNYLALSSDLFDVDVGAGGDEGIAAGAATGAAAGNWRLSFRRDELAAAARRRLSAGVYVRVVAAMGWEARLVLLLAWVPDGDAASGALARAVELHPAITPALAAALLEVNGGGSISGGCVADHTLPWTLPSSSSWARAVAQDPSFVLRIAQIVRQAAAEASGGASASAWDGRRWLPCLLLLGRALAEALRRHRRAAVAVPDGAAAATMDGQRAVQSAAWAEACSEALQEGLCVCQGDMLEAAATSAAATVEVLLLQLARDELASLLDEQQQSHAGDCSAAATGDGRLLPQGPALRLRTRIMLLGMQMASTTPPLAPAAAAAPTPAPPSGGPSIDAAAVTGPAGVAALFTADDVWHDLPFGSAGAGPETAATGAVWGPPTRRLPDWLGAATTAAVPPASPRPPDALQLLLPSAACARNGTPVAAAAPAPRAAETTQVAAAAVALLTPGLGSWLRVQRDPRVTAAAGPDPYSPFRLALALLELLQGRRPGSDGSDGPDPTHAVGPAASAAGPAGVVAGRQLELCLLRMAAGCLACVAAPEQQAALQEVALGSPAFASLRARLAADAVLQAAAGRALVALSNRVAAMEGSLERLALSAQQEAQRLAAAATDLLPYAVLVPEACVRRLVLDGLTHPGQQPWVLQLLRCFAVAAAAPTAGGATPILLACVRDVVLGDAARWLRTAAERRSLLGLLDGLLRAGLLAPRQLLESLVELGLSRAAEDGRRSMPQVHCAMVVAHLVLAGPGTAGLPAAAAYCPMMELAAARPARLLLAAAAAINELYETHAAGRRLEAAAIDVAAAVLERAVQLYGAYLVRVRAAAGGAPALVDDESARELRELSAECDALPRRLLAVQLPLLELAASFAAVSSPRAAGGDEADGGEGGGGADWDRTRALPAMFAPAMRWRPRSLRAADASFARSVVHDTLAFAVSSVAHATAVRRALLDAATDANDAEEKAEVGGATADYATSDAAPSVWSSWGEEMSSEDAGRSAAAASALVPEEHQGGGGESVVARHVAATAARGLPQMPASRLLGGSVEAVAELLPTASSEQARRLLLGLLPALVQTAGGAAALHTAATEGLAESTAPVAAALSMEVLRTWLLAPGAAAVSSRCGGGRGLDAAAVAMSMAMACRAAVAALRATAAFEDAAELLPAVADRCAAHLALLASRLAAAAAGGLAGHGDSRSTTRAAAAHQSREVLGLRGGDGGSRIGVEVAAVALVLLSELCGVASELAAPGSERALDVWQAILLSVLQCFVAALVVIPREAAPPPATTAVVTPAVETAQQMLRSALHAFRTLPSRVSEVLRGSLEGLCEEHGSSPHGEGEAGQGGWSAGWLSAALHAALIEEGE